MTSKQAQASSWRQGNPWVLVAILALLVPVLATRPSEGQNPKKPKGLKVGIVDLGVVFNKYYRKVDLEKEINIVKKKFEDDIKKQDRLIRELDKELEDLDGDKLTEFEDRLALEVQKKAIMKKRMEYELRKKLVDMTLVLLEEINSEIEGYGKKFGYTMIGKVDNQGFGREEFREKIFRAQVQGILYYDAGIDITKPILEILNSKKP